MPTVVFKGKIIEVIQEEVTKNGLKQTYEYARRSPGTRLIIHQGDKITLTKEFRRELNDYDYRLPGGKVFDSLAEYSQFVATGKDIVPVAQSAAIKEAREEAWIRVDEISYFATSICGSTMVWDLIYFVVTKFAGLAQGEASEHEDISVVELPLSEVKQLALSGQMREDRSVSVLLRYLHGLK